MSAKMVGNVDVKLILTNTTLKCTRSYANYAETVSEKKMVYKIT